MHKILVFDLDGTLAPLGKGIAEPNVRKLRQLEQAGCRIAICSGKPTYYLCGLMRQAELQSPILIGENGATFQFGVDLPPKRFFVHPYSEKATEQLHLLRSRIDNAPNMNVWYQPNEVALTPFPSNGYEFDTIQTILDRYPNDLDELAVYRHCDSFDILPKQISKASGLALLSKELELPAKEFAAIGDGPNDLPMFAFADLSLGIGEHMTGRADLWFADIGEALDFLLTN